jgi:tRNA(Arg) A34 adenosine deaminase TadA
MTDNDFMRLAIANAMEAIDVGQIPVGSVLVWDGRVLLAAHNTVWLDTDPSAHAEMNAIRRSARQLGQVYLPDSTIYVTLEPCPMCLSACHWARVSRIVYGAEIADAVAAGFNELTVPAKELARLGRSPIRLEGSVLREECRALFDKWKASGKAKPY